MPARTFIEAIRETLADEMRRDESIIVLGEDVGKKGGVFLATDGLWAEFGDDRVIDTPLTESMIVGASIGAAVNGLRPIAEIQFADFIFPAFNQIVSEAARMRYRSNNGYGVPMVIRAPYGGGVHGALYHSQSVEAFFTHVPGLKVVVPSTPYDARGLLRSSIRDEDPVLFFEHKKMYRSVRGDVPDTDYTVPLGKAAVTHPGSQVSVIAYGLMAHYALEAADRVADDGISVEVVDLRTLRPLDTETVLESVAQDRQVPDRLRGQPVRRLRRGGRRDRRRGGVRLPRRAGDADRRAGRAGRALQPRPRGLVHGVAREDRGRHPQARRVLTIARMAVAEDEFQRLFDRFKAMLAPYAARMHVSADEPRMYGVDMAPECRAGSVDLVRRHAPRQALRQLLPHAGLRPAVAARRRLTGAPEADAGQVVLQLHQGRRAAAGRAGGTDPRATRRRPAIRAGAPLAGSRAATASRRLRSLGSARDSSDASGSGRDKRIIQTIPTTNPTTPTHGRIVTRSGGLQNIGLVPARSREDQKPGNQRRGDGDREFTRIRSRARRKRRLRELEVVHAPDSTPLVNRNGLTKASSKVAPSGHALPSDRR